MIEVAQSSVKAMHICYITHNLPYGAYEAFIIPELKYIMRSGHRVLVIPFLPEKNVTHQDCEFLLKHSVRMPLLNGAILLGALKEVIRSPWAVVKSLVPLRKSRNLAIFMKNLAAAPKALWLAGHLRRTGVPDHIHVHWINASATMAFITAAILNVPWSVTAHRGDIAANNLIAEKVQACSFVRCINQNGASEIQRLTAGGEKICVLHMGVEMAEAADWTAVTKESGRKFSILTPANLVEVKGHYYLIQAIQILRAQGEKVQLDLAGEGMLKKEIQGQIKEAGLEDCIRLLGQLSHAALLSRLVSDQYDCVVLPSIVTERGDMEGTPVALIEAMAAGIPVISTKTGGIPELCREGTAILVQEKDSKALAEALLLLMRDASGGAARIAAAKMLVKEQFYIATIGQELLRLFEKFRKK